MGSEMCIRDRCISQQTKQVIREVGTVCRGFPKGSPPPTGAQADPYIDPIDDDAGWRYRHGAFFRKQAIADVLTADALAS